ncbi:DNA topoisomerase 3 [Paenibacillus sp. WLX2291]|uniref:type IA DNA topoisomerase n=1 Tax=Paenibacillus sp. WLX2291 TaxID=3296934 RepID=UPI0039841B9B
MKILVIAEKPDMGRNIAAVIEPGARNQRTYIEGERYIITWAIGHLIGLAEPEAYDSKYKRWNFGDLPIIPEQFKIVPNPRTKDQLKVIGDLAKQCDRIVNACDAGREGQHIFALIQRQLKLKQPVKRLWISDLTAESIRRGFDQLRDSSEFENLTQAARARSEADWLIGMNASRAFTTKHNNLLSVGRVQTPVLAIIYDRQKEIENFTSQTFYEVKASFKQKDKTYEGIWQGEDRLTDKAKGEAIAEKVRGKEGKISKYEIKESKEYPYKLYDLTLLQRDANAKFGFSAKKTLDVAQALYERHKIISYPRTNSNYVTKENIDGMHKVLNMLQNGDYAQLASEADSKRVHVNNKSVCNPARVEDHHAILPTLKKPGTLSKEEQQLYDLIIRRFLAQFYPPAEYKHHTVLTVVEQETFKTAIKELLSPGWKVTLPDKDKGKPGNKSSKKDADGEEQQEQETDKPFTIDSKLPVQCRKADVKEKETQPPKPYTEGTLLKAMESAGKQIENEELRDAMKESGLGTPATRAATIERLKQVGYVTAKGKKIELTLKGRAAIELIRAAGVELLTSPEMTGQWERRLNQISRGEADSDRFLESVKKFAVSVIDKVRTQTPAAAGLFGDESSRSKGKGKRTSSRTSSSTRTSTSSRSSSSNSASSSRSRSTSSSNGAEGARSARSKASSRNKSSASAIVDHPMPDAPPEDMSYAQSYSTSNYESSRTQSTATSENRENGNRHTGVSETASSSATGAVRSSKADQRENANSASTQSNRSNGSSVPSHTALGSCPRQGCGGTIIEGRKGYGCSHFKQGCSFVIWKEFSGKSVSVQMLKALLLKGESQVLSFKKGGNDFKARIKLIDRQTGKLGVEAVDS